MPGLDLPTKLRRGLGQGKVVPAEELAKGIAPFDADKDGAVTRQELAQYLLKSGVGGPWFCEVVSRSLWTFIQQRLAKDIETFDVQRLARVVHLAMSRGPRPERRYEITPEGMIGLRPLVPIRRPGEQAPPGQEANGGQPRAPRSASPGRPAPATPPRAGSTTPGRPGSPSGSTPAAARPVARPVPRRPGPRR